MYSQTKRRAITHVGVSPNETQALMGPSISFYPSKLSLDNHHSQFVLDALSPNSHLAHFKQIAL